MLRGSMKQTADSPTPSWVSMESDQSMGLPVRFGDGNQSTEPR